LPSWKIQTRAPKLAVSESSDRLDRDRERTEEQEEDDRRREERRAHRPRNALGLAQQEVLAEGRRAAHLHARDRQVRRDGANLRDQGSSGGLG